MLTSKPKYSTDITKQDLLEEISNLKKNFRHLNPRCLKLLSLLRSQVDLALDSKRKGVTIVLRMFSNNRDIISQLISKCLICLTKLLLSTSLCLLFHSNLSLIREIGLFSMLLLIRM